MKSTAKTCILTALLLVLFFPATAQIRSSYFDKPAGIILPDNYSQTKEYPVMVFLPYTTGTAEEYYRQHKSYLPGDVIIMLPQGRPKSSHYLPGFTKYIGWYEERLLKDLKSLIKTYSVDKSRIVIGGHSLGGDLSWALLIRNPDLFSGAVMSGTRASYHTSDKALNTLKRKKFKAAFFIGNREKSVRYRGINNARNELKRAGIETYYREVSGGHVSGPPAAVAAKMIWALNLKNALAGSDGPTDRETPAEETRVKETMTSVTPRVELDARVTVERGSDSDIKVTLENASGQPVTYLAVKNPRGTALRVVFHGRAKNSPAPSGSFADIISDEDATLLFKREGSLKVLKTRPLKEGMKIVLKEDGSISSVYSDS